MRKKASITILMLVTGFSMISCTAGRPGQTGSEAATQHEVHQPSAATQHHPGMEMRYDDHMEMPEHWMSPEEAAKRPNPVPADSASIERGGKLYQTHCAACHGPQGRGDGPAGVALRPRPPDLAEMAGQHPDGDLAWKIEHGRGAMPAWKGMLNETQMWDIVNFLRSL